jgi:hypothetical protein
MTVHVLTRAVVLEAPNLQKYKKTALEGGCIFNPDRKRFQGKLCADDEIVIRIAAALKDHGFLCGRFACVSYALHSRAGCKKQSWHTDYDCDTVSALSIKPLSSVLALQNDTLLCFKDQTIVLQMGDMCVFSGDEVHAGAAYATENTRIFMYIPTAAIETPVNLTYPFRQKSQSSSNKRTFVLSSRKTPIWTRSMSQRTHLTSYQGAIAPIAHATSAALIPSTELTPALPTPVAVATPTPVAVATPTPVAVASPTPVAVASPTPVAVALPTPVAVASPTPVAVATPTPVAIASPTPVAVASPTPAAVATPTPAAPASPTPAAPASPTPAAPASPTPAAPASPTPAAPASPTPVAVATPTPAAPASPTPAAPASPV